MALLCLLAGIYFAREGSRSVGWYAGLCAVYVVALAYCVVLLMESCHRNSCDDQSNPTEYRQSLPHDAPILHLERKAVDFK
jgi:hypothetical protein